MSAHRIRAIIADDEPAGRTNVRVLLRAHPEVEVVSECTTGPETTRAITEMEPDLLFLDVRMPRKSGVVALQDVPRAILPVTIFVTAYEEYALQAFGLAAVDYLLKPYSDARFHEAMERAKSRIEYASLAALRRRLLAIASESGAAAERAPRATVASGRMAIPTANGVSIVGVAEISWIEATGDYVQIHCGGRAHLVRATMSSVARTLDPATFVRIHRSTIVNVEYVREVRRASPTEHHVVLRDGTTRPLSARGREELSQVLRVHI